MKKITETLTAFDQRIIDKADFIREMYESHHAKLFDYSQHLPNTNIKKIELEDNRVIMTTRDRGARIICAPGDFRVAPVETLNFLDYEKNDYKMIERLFCENYTFFDVGANIGWYSINVALAHRSARIHCFEPIPHTYSYLVDNILLNNISNVCAHNFGLSDRAGQFDFYYYSEGSGNASSANVSGRDDMQILKCEVRTLDEFSTEEDIKVDFIKCDVEGAELMVFEGGIKTIARDCPIVFSEILRKWSAKFNYDPNQIFDFFKSLNYRAFTVSGVHLREFFRMNDSTIHTNFFFLHAEKHAKHIRDLCSG